MIKVKTISEDRLAQLVESGDVVVLDDRFVFVGTEDILFKGVMYDDLIGKTLECQELTNPPYNGLLVCKGWCLFDKLIEERIND